MLKPMMKIPTLAAVALWVATPSWAANMTQDDPIPVVDPELLRPLPEPVVEHHWLGMYVDGHIGMGMSSANTVGTIDTSYSLGIGALTRRFSFGFFHEEGLAATPDLGLLGGGFYAATINGLKADLTLTSSDRGFLRLGAIGGRVEAQGFRSVFLIPYASDQMTSWFAGPVVSYTYMLTPYIGAGVDVSYLYSGSSGLSITTVGGRVEWRPFAL